MSEYLTLEWERDALRGLDADVSKTGVRVRRSFVLPWPDDMDVQLEPQRAGEWLRGKLDQLGASARRVLVVLPREDVVLRPLQLPDASDQTLPDIVRYQASAKSAVPLEQLVLDYMPLPATTSQVGRTVLAATAPKRLLTQIQACVEAADLKLASVGVSAIATCATVAGVERSRGLDADETSLVIAAIGQRLEVSLRRSGGLLFAHGTRMADRRDAQAVSIEVQRALVAHESLMNDATIARGWFVGPAEDSQEVCEQVASSLGCEVQRLAPFAELKRDVSAADAPDDPAEFVAPLGVLLNQTDMALASIDFLDPRKPASKPKRTKLLAGLVAAALCVFIAATYGGVRLYLKSLSDKIADTQLLDQQLETVLEEGEPVLELAGFLDQWERRRMDWLDQMRRIGESMPGTERVYLERWHFDTAPGDIAGKTHADGFARERQDVEAVNQRLADQPGLRVRPNPIRTNSGFGYPFQFELDAEFIVPVTSKKDAAAHE